MIRGIREVRQVEVLIEPDHGRRGCEGRFPGVVRLKRVVTDLPAECIAGIVGTPIHTLPEHRGAGPCGSLVRGLRWWPRFLDRNRFLGQVFFNPPFPKPYIRAPRPITWSLRHLVEPLAAYYATYEPPLRFGAKSTPRGRRAA